MNKLAAVLILFVLPLAAQTKADNNLTPGVRLYEPKYLSRARAGQVAQFVNSVSNPARVEWELAVNAIVIRAPQGQPELLDRAEALLKRFDVPGPPAKPEGQIDMTVHLVRAYTSKAEGSVPPELAPVVKEMKGALTYAGFSLVDTIQLTVRDGLKVEDALSNWASGPLPRFYTLEFHVPSVAEDGKTVRVGQFRFVVKIPVSTATGVVYQDEGITTPLTIYEGQKQVIGKIKPGAPSSNDDLFLVLSCKIK